MEAELLKELDDDTWDAVSALVSLCNAADHTSYDTDLDGDFYYIIRNFRCKISKIITNIRFRINFSNCFTFVNGFHYSEIIIWYLPVYRFSKGIFNIFKVNFIIIHVSVDNYFHFILRILSRTE